MRLSDRREPRTMQDLVRIGIADAAKEPRVGQCPLEGVVLAQKTLAECIRARIEDLEPSHVECGNGIVTAHNM